MQITVDLPTAKLLRDAGWEQDSPYFYWRGDKVLHIDHSDMLKSDIQPIAAPTAEEVLRGLPKSYTTYVDGEGDIKYELKIHSHEDINSDWSVLYVAGWGEDVQESDNYVEIEIFGDNLADICARMWIYLKTNGLLGETANFLQVCTCGSRINATEKIPCPIHDPQPETTTTTAQSCNHKSNVDARDCEHCDLGQIPPYGI